MKINRLEIVNFGKLSNFNLDFKDGFQLIFGNNEDGKSTIMSFIKLMFYGDQGRSRNLDQMTRQLYAPWNGSPMEGSLELNCNGVNYRLQKLFGETAGKDKTVLINLDNGTEVPLAKGIEVGKYFFGLDLSGFNRSSFVKQIGNIEPGKDTDDVAEKLLVNLVNQGDEEFSQQDVISRLETAKYGLVSKSGTKGILAEARTNLQNLKEEREQVSNILQQQEQFQDEYIELKSELDLQHKIETEIGNIVKLEEKNQIESLLQLQRQTEESEKEITTDSCSLSDLEELLLNGKNILESREQKLQTVKSIDFQNDNSVYISLEEREQFDKTISISNDLQQLSERYKSLVLPSLEKSQSLQNLLEKTKEEVLQLNSNLSTIEPKKQLKETLEAEQTSVAQQIENTKAEISNQENLWKREKELQSREIESYRTQLATLNQNTKPNTNWLFILLGLLFVSASIACGVLFNYLFFLGVFAGLLFIILPLVIKPRNPNLLATDEIKSKIETSLGNLTKWEQEKLSEITDLKASLKLNSGIFSKNEEKLSVINNEFSIESYNELINIVKSKENEIARLNLEYTSSSENAYQLECQIAQQAKFLGVDSSANLLDSIISTESNYQAEIKSILTGKNLESVDQFYKEFISSQSKEKNIIAVNSLNSEVKELEFKFVSLISTHTPISNFQETVELYSKLDASYKRLSEIKKEASFTANAIGFSDYSMDHLEKVLKDLGKIDEYSTPAKIDELKLKLENLKSKNLIDKLEELQKLIRPPARNLEQIALEISELTEQINELSLYYNGLSTALEIMTKANEEMRQSFGPILNEKTSGIFSRLTEKKYNDVLVNKNYDIQFKSGAHFREWQYLSSGTTDQAYLSLRLAISELISEKDNPMPLFLDDVLIQYDDNRAKIALDFLKEYSEEKDIQLIMFTCHGRLLKFSENIDVPCANIGDSIFS